MSEKDILLLLSKARIQTQYSLQNIVSMDRAQQIIQKNAQLRLELWYKSLDQRESLRRDLLKKILLPSDSPIAQIVPENSKEHLSTILRNKVVQNQETKQTSISVSDNQSPKEGFDKGEELDTTVENTEDNSIDFAVIAETQSLLDELFESEEGVQSIEEESVGFVDVYEQSSQAIQASSVDYEFEEGIPLIIPEAPARRPAQKRTIVRAHALHDQDLESLLFSSDEREQQIESLADEKTASKSIEYDVLPEDFLETIDQREEEQFVDRISDPELQWKPTSHVTASSNIPKYTLEELSNMLDEEPDAVELRMQRALLYEVEKKMIFAISDYRKLAEIYNVSAAWDSLIRLLMTNNLKARAVEAEAKRSLMNQ